MKALFAPSHSDATPTTSTPTTSATTTSTTTNTATALRWRSSAQRIFHATRESEDLLSFEDKAATASSMKNGIHTINEGDDGKKWRTIRGQYCVAAIAWLQQQLQQHWTNRPNHRATVVLMRLLPMLVLLAFLYGSLWSLTIAHSWWRTLCVTIHVLLAVLVMSQSWEIPSSSCSSLLSIGRDYENSSSSSVVEPQQQRQHQLQVQQTQLRRDLVDEWNRLQHHHEYLSAQQGRVQRVHQVDAWLQQQQVVHHPSSTGSLQEGNDDDMLPTVVAVCTQLQHVMNKLRQALSRQVAFLLWKAWIKESNHSVLKTSKSHTTTITTIRGRGQSTTKPASSNETQSATAAAPLVQRVWNGWMQLLQNDGSDKSSIVNLSSAVTLDGDDVLKTWWFTPPVSKTSNPSGQSNKVAAAAETAAAAAVPIDILSALDHSSLASRSNNAIIIPESVVRSRVLAILDQLQRISSNDTMGSAYKQPSSSNRRRPLTSRPIPPVDTWLLLEPYQLIRSTTTTPSDSGSAAPMLDALSLTTSRLQPTDDNDLLPTATPTPNMVDNELLQMSDVPLSQLSN